MSPTALRPVIETLEPRLYLDSTLYFIQDSGSDGLVSMEAENYNTGGQDVGYHDLTPGNGPGAYKTDDVDLEATTDTGGGYDVTGIVPSNSIMEQSWGTGEASVIPGHTYKIRVRWRGENITGPADTSYSTYGMAIKSFGWVGEPSTYNHQLSSSPVLVANEKGDTPWHVSEGTYTIPAGQYTLPFGFILENTITGTAYVDEVGVYEDLGSGNLGQNILRSPKFNSTLDFDPRGAFVMDYILNAAESHGMSMKLVIEEKQDWTLNHMGKDGLPQPYGGQFNSQADTANWQLQEWYWRRLFGQFGAYRSVHSWELANEEEPNNMSHLKNADHLADLADSDGNPHMASTSFWSGLSDTGWNDPASSNIQFTDFHCYTPGTDWLGNDDALAKDLAQWYRDHDTAVANAGFDKPTIGGEVGLGSNGTADYLSQSHNDTNGIWLHKLTWARTSSLSGFIPLYWYTDDIYGKSLYHIYGDFGNFMDGIPFTNGNYVDAAGSSSNTNVRVFGQKDMTNRQAYLWIDNKTHTWWNVVNSPGSIVNQTSNITVNMGSANAQYTVTWWNTYTGAVSSTQTLTANSSGVLTLAVSNLATDTAVKITPVGRQYSPPSQSAPAKPDAKVTFEELAVQEVTRQAPARPARQAPTAPAPVASIKTTTVDSPPARSLEDLSFQLASPKTKAVFHVRIPGGKIFTLDAGLPDMLAEIALKAPLN